MRSEVKVEGERYCNYTLCIYCVYSRGGSVPKHKHKSTHSWAAVWLWLAGTSAGLNSTSLSRSAEEKPRCNGLTPTKKDQVITCQSVTCLHTGVEWRTQTSTGVGVAPMHASQVYLKKKKKKDKSSQSPLQHQLWTVSDQPLDKQAAKDLHRLSSPQKSIQWLWQTFTLFWSQMKERKWEQNRRGMQPDSSQHKKRWYGRLRLFQGVSAVDAGPLLCHRNAFDVSRVKWSRGAMWAMLWFYTASLKNMLNTSKVLITLLARICECM